MMIAVAAMAISCGNTSFKKAKSGMLYKIISSGKDSAVKEGDWLKLYFTQKIGDSVLRENYGKMPAYAKITNDPNNTYNPGEIFDQLRKGDSGVVVMLVDSLLSKKLVQELPPFMKKGDKITFTFKVADVFRNDSTYQLDAQAEYKKDEPRQQKEQEEQMAKMIKERKEAEEKEYLEMQKSGEAAKQVKVVEDYLAKNNITATKIGKGIFVVVKEEGTGTPLTKGKYGTIGFDGRFIRNDSSFQNGDFSRKVGVGELVAGMDEGLQLFKQGGKGTIYVPGFLAYGKNPQPGSPFKPNDALYFNIEVKAVSDTMPVEKAPMSQQPKRN